MRRRMRWICPRCGWKNGMHRFRCRRCRIKCALTRRLAIAAVLGPAPFDVTQN